MKPFFCRMGGKSLLAKQIIDSYFPDASTYAVYVEPFCGACSVFLRKEKTAGHVEVLNDIDPIIFTMLKTVKEDGKYVNEHINRELTKEKFDEIKESTEPIHVIERIRMSFFGKGTHYKKRRDNERNKTNYEKYGDRLKEVVLYNGDWKDVIMKYDSPRTLFYLDPPYTMCKGKSHYAYGTVSPEDVYNILKNVKGKFILSYDDSPMIRDLYKDYNIYEVKTKYSATQYVRPRNANELVITNFTK